MHGMANGLVWDDLRLFLVLHDHLSHAAAARALRVDPTTVGRRIAALERALESRLFDRTSAGLQPTAAAAALVVRARRMEAEALASEREVRGADQRPAGTVVLTAGDGLTTFVLAPQMADLRRKLPGITLELRADNRPLDLTRREAEIALRLFRPTEKSLVARRLTAIPFALFGSAAYLAQRGRPRAMRDLSAHDWLGWDAALGATPQTRWVARHVPGAHVVLRANTTTALVASCAAGAGLALLPTFVAAAEPRLVPVLPRLRPAARDLWVATHPDARGSVRVRAVVAWLSGLFISGGK
jgi:DNA-binding transcriptional LysR family regulator